MISISGVFAVTFSVVFAYVADVTDESERSAAYGLVWMLLFIFLEPEAYFNLNCCPIARCQQHLLLRW